MKNPSFKSLIAAFARILIVIVLAFFCLINLKATLASLDQLKDFGSFVASGRLAAQGRNPYANDSDLIFSVDFETLGHSGSAPNLNPPISVLLFEQVANLSPLISVSAWRALSVAFYVWIVVLSVRHRSMTKPGKIWRALWMFSLAGFWHTIELGQIYTLLLLLASGVYIATEKGKPILAGILLGGLIALKPNFVFWAIALGAAGYWSTLIAAGATSLFISLVPAFFYGFDIYGQWLEASRLFTPDLLIFPGNNSLQGLTARFGSPQAGIVLGILLALGVLTVIHKFKPHILNINTLSVIASLLISPIAWTGYTLLLLPGLTGIDKWDRARIVAAGIFTAPFFIMLALFEMSFFNFVFFGWFYGWGLLFLLFSEIKETLSRSRSDLPSSGC